MKPDKNKVNNGAPKRLPPNVSAEELIARYDALLFDAYGVLFHQSEAIPGAKEMIDFLNRVGKPYFVITNDASKLPVTTSKKFREFGIDIAAEKIITSASLLKNYFSENNLKGSCCIVLGPEDSIKYVENAGGVITSPKDITGADAVIICDEAGFPFLETIDDVLTLLIHRFDAGSQIHLILPNPDLIFTKGNERFGFTGGGIAVLFENALRLKFPEKDITFTRLGKPYRAIFEEAYRRSGSKNMVMIGDNLNTDILGAVNFGIDSALVSFGLTKLVECDFSKGVRPTYILHEFL